VGELLDLAGPGGREHERLSVRADLLDDLVDLRLETHVEHAVGFVHDEVGHATEIGLAGLKHVDKTTGRGDDNLGAALEVADLLTLGHATVDTLCAWTASGMLRYIWQKGATHGIPDSRRRAKLGALLLDLDRELPGRGEDEDDGTVAGCEERLPMRG
jgi:hypothetical protein